MIETRTCYLKYTSSPNVLESRWHVLHMQGPCSQDCSIWISKYINSTSPSSARSAEAWPWGRLPRFAASCRIWLIGCSIPVHINILSWKKPFCYFSLCLRNTSTNPSHNRAFSNSGFSNSAPGDKEIASWHCWFSTTVLNMVREDAEPHHFKADRKDPHFL